MSFVRIAHLSDPHFGTLNEGIEDHLLRSLEEQEPNLVLLTGDITQRARRAQFRAAKKFTRRLSMPIIAVPGNHDIPLYNVFARIFYPYWGFKKLFKNQLEKDFFHGDIQVIGLNSTSRWRHVQGDFSLPRIRARFEAHNKCKIRIAAFHHPMDCAQHVDDKNLLRGREETMQIFDHAKVDLIVGGHIHDPFVTLSDRRYPNIQRRMILTVAGTCLSWRTRAGAPNSFNLIDVDTKDVPRIKITRMDLTSSRGFEAKEVYQFHRIEQNWMPG